MLIDRPERGEGSGTLAVLAQALGPPSAWRARSQSSACALRAIASWSAAGATPSAPMRSSRAVSMD
jgi:hypothetical protein